MDYYPLKHAHVTLACISVLGFGIRLFLSYTGSHWLSNKAVRITPHILDSILAASGIYLAVLIQPQLFPLSWFSLKLLALAGYIGFGAVAIKSTLSLKHASAVAAGICVLIIVVLAVTKPL